MIIITAFNGCFKCVLLKNNRTEAKPEVNYAEKNSRAFTPFHFILAIRFAVLSIWWVHFPLHFLSSDIDVHLLLMLN